MLLSLKDCRRRWTFFSTWLFKDWKMFSFSYYLKITYGMYVEYMLVVQFKTQKKGNNIIVIEYMVNEFELVNKRVCDVTQFAIKSLSCTELVTTLDALRCRASSCTCFNFSKQNVHITPANAPNAKHKRNVDWQHLVEELLPEEPGFAILPPIRLVERYQAKLPLLDNYIDAGVWKNEVKKGKIKLS